MQYEDYHKGGWKEDNQMSYMDMVNKYYDLATSFYEIGAVPVTVHSVYPVNRTHQAHVCPSPDFLGT